ncbi:DUF4132 domain-containing protein [Hymenobacter sp. UYP22]|uniref:DUF4132 domain-containing protein n=1 Tax=Hymenobacter sp. UYP22 TaxID=3156348 RepID=UPI003396AA91
MATSEKFTLAPLPAETSPEALAQQAVLQQLIREDAAVANWHSNISDLPTYQAVRTQDAAYRGQLALAALAAIRANSGRVATTMVKLLGALMRSTVDLGEADFITLFQGYGLRFETPNAETVRNALGIYPVALTLGQVEKFVRKNGVPAALATYLTQFLAGTHLELTGWLSSDVAKLQRRLQALLSQQPAAVRPVLSFPEGDAFGRNLTQFVGSLPEEAPTTMPWLHLLQLWQRASGGQPTAKYRQELTAAVAAVGPEDVRTQGGALLATLAALNPEEITTVTEHPGTFTIQQLASMYGAAATITPQGYSVARTEIRYLLEPSQNVAKGLIWTLAPLANERLLALLTSYAAKCFRKIPGKGPLAAGLGNACLLALSQNGLPGVAALARVRSNIRQTNTQELIARYIAQESQKLGVSPAEIEDMAVPDSGLENGRLDETFGDYTATLTLHEGKAEVQWLKADKALKSAPAALKATHPDELKELKAAQTQAQQTYTTQRDRLDRSFVDQRRIPWPWFAQYYFRHGLLSLLARPLIWRLHRPDGAFQDAIFQEDAWQDALGQVVPAPTPGTELQLWHPVLTSADEVLAWRRMLDTRQIRQPLKQAFREVYLLTPPEERTRTYSNRMAAHILKQHQFNSLAKLRGWRYRLLGAYDKGYDSETASLPLPIHDLTAEFWVSEVYADGEWNDTGIYNYVSTDQVRFTRANEPVPLPEIPALVFSEVMRDVDLFVGVASVGNDPQWRDNGGLAQFRTYWESYSFGDLSEVAKTRKLALERLVPRLKIGRVSEIKGNFLVVKGHRHVYKIHLGSGNILMEPNDQYLCIVPDRSSKQLGSTDVFLPFEGDAVLSIILSKALLLMDDDKITDETILRQL